VPADLSSISTEWDSVQESLVTMRAAGDDFEAFFDQTFGELESMCKVLDQHEQCLQDSAREHLGESSQGDGEKDSQLARQLQESNQQQAELQQQQALLEAELESVRGRAAQTDRLLGEQRKDAATQQSEWAAELKNMRTALEQVSTKIDSRPTYSPPAVSPTEAVPTEAMPMEAMPVAQNDNAANNAGNNADDAANDDAVLDTVMAQFQMLQKDVARRRENAPG
jgi:hypothetical protein